MRGDKSQESFQKKKIRNEKSVRRITKRTRMITEEEQPVSNRNGRKRTDKIEAIYCQ